METKNAIATSYHSTNHDVITALYYRRKNTKQKNYTVEKDNICLLIFWTQ